jgi:hypothetical protein
MGYMIRKLGIERLPLSPSHLDHPCGPLIAITKTIWRALNQWRTEREVWGVQTLPEIPKL